VLPGISSKPIIGAKARQRIFFRFLFMPNKKAVSAIAALTAFNNPK